MACVLVRVKLDIDPSRPSIDGILDQLEDCNELVRDQIAANDVFEVGADPEGFGLRHGRHLAQLTPWTKQCCSRTVWPACQRGHESAGADCRATGLGAGRELETNAGRRRWPYGGRTSGLR